jgi:hypothetical protein
LNRAQNRVSLAAVQVSSLHALPVYGQWRPFYRLGEEL